MITCGLLTAFQLRGVSCRSFKCGPDFIDPMFHKQVQGIEGGNLDTYFLEKEQVKDQFISLSEGAELSVIEGVMGYYDGVGGNTTQASTYEVACAIDAPAILILDCKGASLSLAAIVKGFLEYKNDSHIAGIILNRTTEMMAKRLAPEFEALGVKVYGYLPQCEEASLDSRHLGLVLPAEIGGLKEKLRRLAEIMETTLDIDGLLELAGQSNPLSVSNFNHGEDIDLESHEEADQVSIGLAMDEAFCFYYQENLELLKRMGAKLIPFSPCKDRKLPEGISGLLLGGGYPELHTNELSENHSMQAEIKEAYERSLPILAECGGFMYLHEELSTDDGTYQMAGIIGGKVFPTKRLGRFGYIEVYPKEDLPFLKKGESIRGHEFHYWDSENNGDHMTAVKPGQNRSWDCVHGTNHLMAGFPHFYYPSNPSLPRQFINACKNYKSQELCKKPISRKV
jgi:cobyrinic acid a,c-diamide synthase